MFINGVEVTVENVPDISYGEVINYTAMLTNEHGGVKPRNMTISVNEDGKVILDYELRVVPFERIRHITGYLVGDIKRWNDAKRAEEHDRVKHGVC